MAMADPGEHDPVPARRARWLRPLLLTTVAVAGVLVLALVDTVTVTSAAALRGLDFGMPLAWITQDQGHVDAPLPYLAALGSPWENPTTVRFGPLSVDLAVVFLVVLAVGLLTGVIPRRPGPRRPGRDGSRAGSR